MNRIKKWIAPVGAFVLGFVPFVLAQVTTSGSAVTLEAADITAMTSAGGDLISSLLDNFVSLLPVIVLILVGFMVFGLMKGVFSRRRK